jgi:hypothetical protein
MPRTRRDREEDGLRRVVSQVIEARGEAPRISPTWVATEAMLTLDGERSSPPLVHLGCHLHLRQLAREVLRGKYEPDADTDDDAQHELWPYLQKRYPTAKSTRDDPEYVLLEEMTEADVGYNVARLRAESHAKLRHADSLEAWGRRRHAA